mgnify:CR=1 FL=1
MLTERYYTAWGAADSSNTAQAGAALTITLAAAEAAAIVAGWSIALTGGTGAGQQREITGYNGATRVADVDHAWDTIPDATSTYSVYATPDRFVGVLWDESADEFVFGRTHRDPGAGNIVFEGRMAARFAALTAEAASSVAGGLTLTGAGITMTGLNIGTGAARMGTAFGTGLDIVGTTGANDSDASDFTLTLGLGGTSVAGPAGEGGDFVLVTGAGGAAADIAAGGAGTGGDISFTAGNGGAAIDAVNDYVGGVGGAFALVAGNGGVGAGAINGGTGGGITFTAGSGGAGGGGVTAGGDITFVAGGPQGTGVGGQILLSSGVRYTYTTASIVAYPVPHSVYMILVDCTANAVTATLPAAASYPGRRIAFKRVDAIVANAALIEGNAAETIDGALNQALPAQWDSIVVMSDGTNWVIEG